SILRQAHSVRSDALDDDAAVSGHDGVTVQPLPLARRHHGHAVAGNLQAAVGARMVWVCVQHLSAAAVFHDDSERVVRSGANRWMQRAGDLLADHSAALAAGAVGGGAVRVSGDLERLSRPADLPAAAGTIHAGAGIAELPEQSRRDQLA